MNRNEPFAVPVEQAEVLVAGLGAIAKARAKTIDLVLRKFVLFAHTLAVSNASMAAKQRSMSSVSL